MSDPIVTDPAALDPHGDSLLEAQRLAAERVQAEHREWQRLRRVDHAARDLVLEWLETNNVSGPAMAGLLQALGQEAGE